MPCYNVIGVQRLGIQWTSICLGTRAGLGFRVSISRLFQLKSQLPCRHLAAHNLKVETGGGQQRKARTSRKVPQTVLRKELAGKWLFSLSSESSHMSGGLQEEVAATLEVCATVDEFADNGIETGNGNGNRWVLGIDPDVGGAVALLKPAGDSEFDSASSDVQVYDAPTVQVFVGKRARRRPDTRSIVSLLHELGIPKGSLAYIEQSLPFPKDGKQGWYSCGFGYGLWIGILVSLGISVIPIPSVVWKKHFDLVGKTSSKDASRVVACDLFPHLSSQLKRKKDHGRAEALLIARYGRDIMKISRR